MSAIAIGNGATHKTEGGVSAYTIICKDNPANASGVISSVSIWCYNALTGLRLGTFYLVSGTTYKCRDSASVTSSAQAQTFTGLSLAVVAGDFIGYYTTTGAIASDTTSGGTLLYVAGEYIDPGDSASFGSVGNTLSLGGAGITPAGVSPNFLPFFWA